MVDVGGDDGAPARNFIAHEFRRHEARNIGAKALALRHLRMRAFQHLFAAKVFARGNVDHFFGDDSGAGEFILRDVFGALARQRIGVGRAGGHQLVAGGVAIVLGLDRAARIGLEAATGDPGLAHARQAFGQIDSGVNLRIGAGGVIDVKLRLGGIGQQNLAQRHMHVVPASGGGVDLARAGQRTGGHGFGNKRIAFGLHIHGRFLLAP